MNYMFKMCLYDLKQFFEWQFKFKPLEKRNKQIDIHLNNLVIRIVNKLLLILTIYSFNRTNLNLESLIIKF